MPGSAVILWWGADIRLLAGDGKMLRLAVAEADDPVPAILRLAGETCAPAQAVRVIYHPDTLDAHEVSCPNTSRSRLRKILLREFRALGAPDAVWSVEPIRRGTKGCATVLYLDQRSPLPRLLAGLAGGGWPVEGVWPLQSLVEATPPCAMARDGFLSLVVLGRRGLVSCVGPSGDRSLRFLEGPECVDGAIAELGSALARFEEGATPPGLMIVEDGGSSGALEHAPGARALTAMAAATFLSHARTLPAGGFSDFVGHRPFLARPPPLRPTQAAAGLALVLAALGLAWNARQDRARTRRQFATAREQQANLRQWVEDRAAAQARIDQLTLALSRIPGRAQPLCDFLAALDRATPTAIALQEVTIQGGALTVRGRIIDDAGPSGALSRLWRVLAVPDAPWHLDDLPAGQVGADFTLRGSIAAAARKAAAP